MRLINTSVDTTFVFTIDDHEFWVMSSDFVPIKPYKTNHVVIGIGTSSKPPLAVPLSTDIAAPRPTVSHRRGGQTFRARPPRQIRELLDSNDSGHWLLQVLQGQHPR